MSAIKDGRLPIVLDKERHLLFSLNVIDEMQDKFGGFDKLAEMLKGKDGIKNLRWLLTLLLNEGADDGEEQLTEKQVGKMIHTGNFNEVKTAIFKAFAMGNSGTTEPPQDDEDDEPEYAEEERKNAQAGITLLHWPEREVWRMTPYKILALFRIHREFNPDRFKPEEKEADIDDVLGGL